MHLREVQPRDFYDMGVIQATCNKRDTIARYFIKEMDKYWTTYRRSSTRYCKRQVAVPGAIAFVAETDSSDYAAKEQQHDHEIVGFVIWTRIGDSAKAQEWKKRNQGGFAGFNRLLDNLEDRYLKMFTGVEPTYDREKYAKIIPKLALPFDHEVFSEAWEVQLFFVSPEWQRKGIGRKLLQWGFDRAEEEKVPVVVKSSALGVAAYKGCGFRSMGDVGMQHLFDPLEFGGEQPQMLCWEPKSCEGQWFEKGKAALEKLKNEGNIQGEVEEKLRA